VKKHRRGIVFNNNTYSRERRNGGKIIVFHASNTDRII
jgi:hypothetical protein